METGFQPNTRTHASAGKPTHQNNAAGQLTAAPLFQRHASTTNTAVASASNSHRVAGARPACSMAIVNAPKATNSPCGMKITRVTENTSTNASAINP